VWLLHAYSGHAGVLAASHQKQAPELSRARGRYLGGAGASGRIGGVLGFVRSGREPNVPVDDGVCRNAIAMGSPFGAPFTGRFCGLSYGTAPRATARVADPHARRPG
jgi:hypothetical protein